jgi:hypothetical protein
MFAAPLPSLAALDVLLRVAEPVPVLRPASAQEI